MNKQISLSTLNDELSQEEYNKKYNRLVNRYEKASSRLKKVPPTGMLEFIVTERFAFSLNP